jgi:DNA-binding transcriptional LysR family regulator
MESWTVSEKHQSENRTQRLPLGVELRHFRYFLAVAEELHFGRAAARLHIAQPPLSQAIRKLEDELGVMLFERTSRHVALTDAGRVLAGEARKVLSDFEIAVAETRRAGGAGAVLRIGCIIHLPVERLLRLLGALHERDPDSPTQVRHLLGLEQVQELRSGSLDIGIFDHAEDHSDLEYEPLFPGERLAVFLPPDHLLGEKQVVGPEDLKREKLVMFNRELNPALHKRVIAGIEQAGYSFAGIEEVGVQNVREIMLAVAEGRGVAFGPFSFRELTEAGTIVSRRQIDPPASMPDTVIAWRANAPPQLRPKLELVREVARTLRGNDGSGAAV